MNTKVILLICGSMNSSSKTKLLLQELSYKLKRHYSYDSELLDLYELSLPVFDPNAGRLPMVNELAIKIERSNGLIIGSPEYHGSFTGALKNFLDYFGFDQFTQKPTGLLAHSAGIKSGTNTLSHLRTVLRNIHANVISEQVAISNKEYNEINELPEPLEKRMDLLLSGLDREIKKAELYEELILKQKSF